MQTVRYLRRTKAARAALIPLVTGIAAGAVNGLLGAGGGIVVILVLGTLARRAGSTPASERDIPAASLLSMLPVSVLSAAQYASAGRLEIASFAPLLLPTLIGGVVGGILLDRLKLPLLNKLFALLLIVSGGRMLLR